MNSTRGMPSSLHLKSLVIYPLLTAFMFASLGCSYKPSYLTQSEKTPVANRWKVQSIDASLLSPDETIAWEKLGSPQYIRFFRGLSSDRDRVYEWVYTNPVRLISFVDGKSVAYIVVDEDPSSLNEDQKNGCFGAV